MNRFQIGFALLFLVLAGCKQTDVTEHNHIIDPEDMDLTVEPKDDFYQYANGGWLEHNPCPETESRWTSFSVLIEENRKRVRDILTEAAKATDAAPGSEMQKIGDFYRTAMDSTRIDELGISPLQSEIDRIDAISDREDLFNAITHLQKIRTGPAFRIFAGQDSRRSDEIILYFSQGGLSLPDRDYYLKTGEKDLEIIDAYKKHVATMLELSGIEKESTSGIAESIFEFEKQLAEASRTRLENRDPHATYNKFHFDEVNSRYTNLDLNEYFTAMSIPKLDSLIVRQPEFMDHLNDQLASAPLETWKNYLRWKLIRAFSPELSSDFVNENFAFFSQKLRGTKKMKPRWKRMQSKTEYALGEIVGKEFVSRHFPPEAKERCLDMVNSLLQTYGERIDKLDWMSDDTKTKAREKLAAFKVKIGYPDKWKDYSNLDVVDGDHIQNIMNANIWRYEFNIAKIGKPVDKTEWYMNPQMVNAYYSGTNVEIVFPAGILQPPFFDPKADDAINFGGIGGVIGHEITHGFDDNGRKYNASGNLQDWWTEEDAERFQSKADMIVEQYNSFTVCDTVHVNGKLTLGENIADLGGVAISYEAFKKTDQFKNQEMIEGFDPTQRFFLSWARIWRSNMTDKEAMRRIIVDTHAPDRHRVTGPFSHMDEFYESFGIANGDPLYRPDSLRVAIW